MRIAILGLVFVGLLAGCSKSADDGDKESSFKGTYNFESNGCSTGEHAYSSLADYCEKLQDSALNHGCAFELREMAYKQSCPSGLASPAPVTPPPAVKPPPEPPARATCFKPAEIEPTGTELTLETFADGGADRYRLVSMTGMIVVDFKKTQMSLKVLTTASTVASEKAASILACKEMSEAPDGLLEGKFVMPGEIRRDGGIIDGGVRSDFATYGKNSSSTERIEGYKTNGFDFSSLTAFVARLKQDGGSLRIFRHADDVIQLVVQTHPADRGFAKTMKTLVSALYKRIPNPPPAPANPSPEQGSAPGTPTPGNESRAWLEKICDEYSYTNDKVTCLLKFKNVSVPKEAAACEGYSYTNDKVSCVLRLKDKNFSPGIGKICGGYSYVNDQISCLSRLADIQVSPAQISVCSGYSYVNDQVSCILRFK